MANPNTPRGLIPYAYTWGGPYNGSVNTYFVPSSYATALFVGDPVDIVSTSNDANGIPAVQLATVGSPILGVVVGIINGGDMGNITAVTRDQPIYHPASTAQYLAIADDPNLLFWVQDDASSQARAPNLWAGRNANLVSGTGSTVTGYSGWQLAASTVATTNTLDLKIIRQLQQADNVIGTAANTNMNAKWLVKLNNSRFANQIAGV
jgi:hypothetical protein